MNFEMIEIICMWVSGWLFGLFTMMCVIEYDQNYVTNSKWWLFILGLFIGSFGLIILL